MKYSLPETKIEEMKVEGWSVVYYVSKDFDGVRVDSVHRREAFAQDRADELRGSEPSAKFDWKRVTNKRIFVVPIIPLI